MSQVHSLTFGPFQENTYIIEDPSGVCSIIDPGCSNREEEQQLKEFIEGKGLKVEALWNTHCHIDHVLGNDFVCREYGLKPRFTELELDQFEAVKTYAAMYGFPGYVESATPEEWLVPGENIRIGDTEFQVLFGPGHTSGHVALYNAEEDYVIGGDILFKGSFGRVDLPGGDMETLKKTLLEVMFELPENTVVHSGHGPETTIGVEKKTNYIWEFVQ